MQCKCGGVLIDGKSTFRTSRKNFSFILDNIPAKKCMRCDEVQFSEETREKLELLAERIERGSSEIVKIKPGEVITSYRKSTKNFTFIMEHVPAAKGSASDDNEVDTDAGVKIKKLVNMIERDSNEIITGKHSPNLFDY
ncbi:MAG TPA: YgiT-type zinc finger protein [Spirochaetota bacterium]|nr:YgiT-type zinc finger protein [Spirochaetota bacterium]